MGNSYIHREISHPVGFWHWKQIWMVTQTPGENTRSRTRRPHYKDRFVYLILHFNITVSRPVLRASSSDFLVQPRFSKWQISRSFVFQIGSCPLAYTGRRPQKFFHPHPSP